MLVVLLLLLITGLILWSRKRPNGFPPGPPCVPIFGSLPFTPGKHVHLALETMKEKYGPVIGLKLGSVTAVAICGGKEVREVLRLEEFQGRYPNECRRGIMFTDGKFWSDQRRFAIRHLREFGLGRTSIEGIIFSEIKYLLENSFTNRDKIQVSGLFNTSAANVLWTMVGGKRYNHDDVEFQNLLMSIRKSFRKGSPGGGLSIAFPFLYRLFGRWSGYREEEEARHAYKKFFQKSIREHRDTQHDSPRDFIDIYLQESSHPDNPSFNEETLIQVCVDLFSAGAESVGNSLSFCLLYLVLYPKWQDEIIAEVNSVVGPESRPSVHDRQFLPKTEAFISEVTRINTIAPITIPHATTTDVLFRGYYIPKRTYVLVSMWSVLHDKEHWKDPENFRPDRFLDNEGNYKKDDWLKPFGLGKRNCLGESLASSIMFLFLTTLMQEFTFSVPEGDKKPSIFSLAGTTVAPRPFDVVVKRRKKTRDRSRRVASDGKKLNG